MSTTPRVTSLGELIAILPYSLGFRPHESLVVVGLKGGVLDGVARADLSDVGPGEGCVLLAPLLAHGVDAVVVIGLETVAGQSHLAVPEVAQEADAVGLHVLESVVVRDGRWWRFGALETLGEPVPQPDRVGACLAFIAAGAAPLPDRDSVAALVRCHPDRSRRIQAVLTAAARTRPVVIRSAGLQGWAALAAPSGAWHLPADPRTIAAMGQLVLSIPWRDGLLAWLVPGSLPTSSLPSGVSRALRRHLPRPGQLPPAPEVLARLAALCAVMPDEVPAVAAQVCAMTAVVGWHAGDGALAGEACNRALDLVPGHSLADLMGQLIAMGAAPPRGRAGRARLAEFGAGDHPARGRKSA